jgi:small subunit ribosomal protein S13
MELSKEFKNKTLGYMLKNRYGLSFTKIQLIMAKLNINPKQLVKKLKKKDLDNISNLLINWNQIDYVLKNKIFFNKKHLIEIKSYRGLRYLLNYPANGQRTRSNAKTVKKLK